MVRGKFLAIGGLAAALPCFLLIVLPRHTAPREATPPPGWPQRLGERALHVCEYGFIYAEKESSADQLREVLATVVEDVNEQGVAAPGAGLILVVDADDEYPCEAAGLVERWKTTDPNLREEQSTRDLKTFVDAEKRAQELGLDISVILSLAPIPIRLEALQDMIGGLPADVGRRVRWCVICPTDGRLKAGVKKTVDAGLKKAKPSLAERTAFAALRPLAERMGVDMMKKARRAGLYALLLDTDKDLPPEQKRRMVASYRAKLGLGGKVDRKEDANTPTDPGV